MMIIKYMIVIQNYLKINMFIKNSKHPIENLFIIERKRKEKVLIIHLVLHLIVNQIIYFIKVLMKMIYMTH